MPHADPAFPQALESLIAGLTEAHEGMLALVTEHREALSRADTAAIARCLEQQGAVAARIADLELQRRRLVSGQQPTANGQQPTLTSLAECLREPDRSRLIAAAARLHDVLLRVQQQTRTLRAATQSLLSHMNGLMQQVARSLSQARLYGPRGEIDPGGPVACGVDLTH